MILIILENLLECKKNNYNIFYLELFYYICIVKPIKLIDMIDYREYPEIKAMATVRVINFNDECEGVGLSLRQVANNGYNAFRLVKFNSDFDKAHCVSALQDYIAVTNTERFNNGYNHMLKDENILIVCQHTHGHQYAVPFDYYKCDKRTMFSGIYIAGDSSMSDMLGHHYPIGVHNRVEE